MLRCNDSDEKQPLLANEKPEEREGMQSKGFFPFRFVFIALGCLGLVNVYIMRVNLSVALVVMVNETLRENNISSECLPPFSNESDVLPSSGEFVWDEKTQGLILGSFFWGYILTQLPGGRMAEVWNGKWVFGLGILCTSIFTLLTPTAARNGVGYLMAVRMIEGFGEGVTYPAMHSMISKWAPRNERSRFVSIIGSGGLLGTVIGLPLSGYLCIYGFDGGWPSAFYMSGTFGIIWFILWALFAYDGPDSHPWISEEEKLFYLLFLGKRLLHHCQFGLL